MVAISAMRKGARRRARTPLILQSETSECGLASLCMVAAHFGNAVSIAELRERFPISLRGMTLRQAIEIASTLGLHARAVRCEQDDLGRLALPAMLHWDLQHFVVLTKVDRRGFHLHDPGRGSLVMGAAELGRHFTGVAVLFEQRGTQFEVRRPDRLSIGRLVGRVEGIGRTAALVLVLSLVAEIFLLMQPLTLRYMLDYAFFDDGSQLAFALVGVAVLAAVCGGFVTYARDCGVGHAASRVSTTMARNLFGHSLSLPMAYFEKRLTGDLVYRYRSVEAIERFLTGELPVAALDGLVTLVSLAILFWIAPWIALATLVMFGTYMIFRLTEAPQLRSAEASSVFARAHETGYLIETLQHILSIKVRASEVERQSVWMSRFSEAMTKQRDLAVLHARQRAMRVLIGGLDIAAFALLSFLLFRTQALGLGGVFAILFYKTHFFVRSTAMVERIVGFRMLAVQLDRLEDIVSARSEASGRLAPGTDERKPALSLDAVSFRYSPLDPFILRDTSLTIESGEFVVLTGPSGTGKTTLLKLVLGLYVPTSGRVACAGISLSDLMLDAHRRQFGVVMQDDHLLVGTVAENVCFFSADIDMERVEWACRQACIAEDIGRMPMGYMTGIGGGAGGLSGGQRQRLMIARALYHDVRFLLLDEGTANLDPHCEMAVLTNVKALGITTLMIAHGTSPIGIADKVLAFGDDRRITQTGQPAATPRIVPEQAAPFRALGT